MMGSLLLCEKWPGQRDGCLHHLFAPWGAVAALGHSFGPACILTLLTRPGSDSGSLSRQMTEELISLANSWFDPSKAITVWGWVDSLQLKQFRKYLGQLGYFFLHFQGCWEPWAQRRTGLRNRLTPFVGTSSHRTRAFSLNKVLEQNVLIYSLC